MSRASLFKFVITIALVLSLAAVSHAQLFTLQNGNFQLAGGAGPVANGSVVLTLSNPAATVIATGAAATPVYTINLDANGNMPLTQVYGNASLTPPGTFYSAQLYTGPNGTGTLISTSTWPVGPSAPYSGSLYPSVMVLPAVSFSGGVVVPSSTITFSATPTFNAGSVSKFYLSLSGNVTSSTLTGAVKDQLLIFVISQDGVGSRTFTWPTNVKGQAIASGAGLTSTQAFSYDGTNAWPIGEMTVSSGTTDVRGNNGVFTGTLAATGGLTAGSMPALTGDVTSSAGSTVTAVTKVNGVSYPLTAPAHSVPVVTTAGSATTYKVVPDCQDTTGNHINYTQSTDAFSCGSSTGNNVLNAQGAVAALTGNSTDQVVYTYSLPANTVDTTSKGILITCGVTHNSGTANPSVKININGVNAATGVIGTIASQSVTTEAKILRTGTTTAGSIGKVTSSGNLVPFTQALSGLAWTSNQTITCTFNVATPDQMTGVAFLVEKIQ
jgi:hypothetical protein